MSRKSKQHEQLDVLEADFRVTLSRELTNAITNSHSQLFLSTRHNPWPEISPWTNKRTDELLALADEILGFRRQLHESATSALASRFVEYCEEFNNVGNPKRLGVQKHAQKLLGEIEAGRVV